MLNVYIQCRGATVKIPIPDTCTLTLFLYEMFRETPKKLTIFFFISYGKRKNFVFP